MENKKPFGVKLIIFLSIVNLLISIPLLFFVYFQSGVFEGIGVSNSFGSILYVLSAILSIAFSFVILVAIGSRTTGTYKVSSILLKLSLLLSVIYIIYSIFYLTIDEVLSSSLGLFMAIFVFWYLLKTKNYFTDKSVKSNSGNIVSADKKVKYFIIFIILYFIAIVFLGVFLDFKNEAKTGYYVNQFENMDYEASLSFCNSDSDELNCLITLAFIEKDKGETRVDICEQVEGLGGQKTACFAIIDSCESLESEEDKDECSKLVKLQSNLEDFANSYN